jgi:hypothetical protein
MPLTHPFNTAFQKLYLFCELMLRFGIETAQQNRLAFSFVRQCRVKKGLYSVLYGHF